MVKHACQRLPEQRKVVVDHQDVWQAASLGVACVSNESARLHQQLETVVHWVEQNRPDVEIVGYRIEIL